MTGFPITLLLNIPGTPRPQQRGRHVHGRLISTTSKPLKLWRAFVIRHAQDAMRAHGWRFGDPAFLSGAIRMDVTFTFEAPAGFPERIGQLHAHKPDRDNLEKSLMDALTEARLYGDDCQVSAGDVTKRWGVESSTVVRIGRADAPPLEVAYEDAPAWLSAAGVGG